MRTVFPAVMEFITARSTFSNYFPFFNVEKFYEK